MSCASVQGDEKLVIIGGGPTGSSLAKHTQKMFNVTLIERREAMVLKPAGVRAVCTADYMSPSLIPLTNVCPKGKVIRGEAKSVDTAAKTVLLADGQSVPYDYLAICTGGINMSPAEASGSSIKDMIQSWTETMEKIKASKKCVIIGGGPVGVELAGEIAHWHQEVKVTIVHSGETLCSNTQPLKLPKKNIDKLTKQLEERGVEVIVGDRAEADGEGPLTMDRFGEHKSLTGQRTLTLKSGRKVECDLVLWCTGFRPESSVLSASAGLADKVDERGQVKVNKFLQVEGLDTVFSLGDCNNWPETKMLMTSMSYKGAEMIKTKGQCDIAMKNMDQHRKGKPMVEYVGNAKMSLKMMITVGETGTVWGMPEFMIGAKGRDLMTQGLNGDFGHKIKIPPKVPPRKKA